MNVADLPRAAADKLGAIEDAASEAQTLAASTLKRVKEVSDSLYVIDDAKVLASAEHELARLRALQSKHQRRHSDLSSLLANLHQFVQSISEGQKIGVARPPRVQAKDSDNPAKQIEGIRAEIAAAKQQMQVTRNAVPPKSDLKAQVPGIVADWGRRGRPNMKVSRAGLEISFDDPSSFGPSVSRNVALMAWLLPKQVIAAIEQQISEMPEPVLSLTSQARDTRLSELATALDELERIEEGLIERAEEAQGRFIERRFDASPSAVLGITLKLAVPQKAV